MEESISLIKVMQVLWACKIKRLESIFNFDEKFLDNL